MRTMTMPDKNTMSTRAQYLVFSRMLPALLLLLAMLMLPTACSKEGVNSDNSTPTQLGELEEALASGKPTLAGFVAPVCACKNITPTLEELAVDYEERCNVLILDYYDYKGLFAQYDITLVPTQVYFDSNGAEVERIVGYSTKEEMVNRLAGMGV
jgi:thioredoxin 1